MSVGLVYDPIYLGHETGDHVENGLRVERTIELLSTSKLTRQLVPIAPEPAAMEDLLLVLSSSIVCSSRRPFST